MTRKHEKCEQTMVTDNKERVKDDLEELMRWVDCDNKLYLVSVKGRVVLSPYFVVLFDFQLKQKIYLFLMYIVCLKFILPLSFPLAPLPFFRERNIIVLNFILYFTFSIGHDAITSLFWSITMCWSFFGSPWHMIRKRNQRLQEEQREEKKSRKGAAVCRERVALYKELRLCLQLHVTGRLDDRLAREQCRAWFRHFGVFDLGFLLFLGFFGLI